MLLTLVCEECGAEMLNSKSGVLFIWKNGGKQLCDRWECPVCNKAVYTGFGDHIGHKISERTELISTRYYQKTRKFYKI